jgi:hypothetical protein
MARRKRASLKDKGPEALGLTPKKGKGIDVLFGGPPGEKVTNSLFDESEAEPDAEQPQTEDAAVETPKMETEPEDATIISQPNLGEDEMPVESDASMTNSAEEVPVVPPPAPPISSGEVDELGLPVAMETPPDDLEFASSATGAELPATEHDAFDPTLSPFASPVPPAAPQLDDDLSGLMEENLAGPAVETGMPLPSGPSVATTPDEPLPDVATMPAAETPPPTDIPFTPPSPITPDSFTSPVASVSPPPPPSQTPAPVPVPTSPPTTPTSYPVPRVTVESLGGIVTERIETSEEDILPPDLRDRQDVSNVIELRQRAQVERDDAVAERVVRYIGQERRENLDREIERLYDQVAKELSVNKQDVEFALRTLSEAQDILFEDARQYDEALYRVAVVKTMLARKQNLRHWSYTWGLTVFFYALVWLGAFIAAYVFTGTLSSTVDALAGASQSAQAVRAAWFSALAGGIGGIIGIFYSLYWHVAMKQDFDRQYVMYYLVQPIMGFVLGAVVYFIVAAGFLVISFAAFPEGTSNEEVLASRTVIALQIVLGFVAGFRQRVVFEMIDRIVKKLLPRSEEEPDQNPVSLVPAERREKIRPPTAN